MFNRNFITEKYSLNNFYNSNVLSKNIQNEGTDFKGSDSFSTVTKLDDATKQKKRKLEKYARKMNKEYKYIELWIMYLRDARYLTEE